MPAFLEDGKKIGSASVSKEIKAVKDFESVFITKLLEAMDNTIGDWGLEKDAGSKQIRGIFSMFLGRHLGQCGGFGLWKDIYKSLNDTDNPNETIESGG